MSVTTAKKNLTLLEKGLDMPRPWHYLMFKGQKDRNSQELKKNKKKVLDKRITRYYLEKC